MSFSVAADVLTITLPSQDEAGKTLPPAQVVGPSYLTFSEKRRIASYSQKENLEIGYLTDLSKLSEMTLIVWSQGEEVHGRVRDRHGQKLLPFAADTVTARETSADDLEYISFVLCHIFFPQHFPFGPEAVAEESSQSADPNEEVAPEPEVSPPPRPPAKRRVKPA